MATNPLSAFLSNFQSATARSGVDPIREQALLQDERKFQAERPMRNAQTEYYSQQARTAELENQQTARDQANQQWAQAEVRAQELGGIENAMSDPVFRRRAVDAVNSLNQAQGGGQQRRLVDFEQVNSQNRQQWGMGQGIYDDVLTGRNPNHVRGQDDDELLVPIYEDASGNVGPMEMDDGGGVETWSRQEGIEFLRGQFVGSDEYGRLMGSMHTGGGGGASAGGGPSLAAPPGQPSQPSQPSRPQAVGPDAITSANQVTGGQQPRTGEVEIVPTPPARGGGVTPPGDRQGQAADQRRRTQGPQIDPEAVASSSAVNLPEDRQSAENTERLNRRFRRFFGEAGERTVRNLPPSPDESDETALGVPSEQIPDDAPREVRRVSEGKGISPAQAKSLALDSSQLPAPKPRSAVAAGGSLLDGLEPQDEGEGSGQSSGGGGPANIGATTGGYTVSGGRRPTHKQLTSAVILNRAGMLDDESLTRFADLGVMSSDGVDTIQTGMQESAANLRQEMQNATDLQQTRMQEQAAMDRTLVGIQGDLARDRAERQAEADQPLSFAETREQANQTAQAHLEASGMDREQAIERGRQYGARLSSLASNSEGLRQSEFGMGQLTDAMIELDEYSRRYNESQQGMAQSGVRQLMGRETSLDLGDNPLAIMLTAEGSNVAQVSDPNIFEQQFNINEEPTLVRSIQQPMVDTARQMGAMGAVQDNPDLQYEIYDIATEYLRGQAAEQGDRSILNDETAVRQAVMDATQSVLGQGG